MSNVEITGVRSGHEFDEAALDRYLAEQVEGYSRPLQVRQFEGGQSNPTFLLETPTQRLVLRKQPPGDLLPSAHQVDREHRVMKALAGTPVPVPQMICLCEDTSIIGSKFYVMEMVEGRVFTDPLLPDMTSAERRAIYLDLARVNVLLHDVDPAAVGLENFGPPGNYYERQIRRWTKQYLASKTENIDAMNQLIDWLPANLPALGKTVIVHGDLRLGNVIVHPTEPRIVALLDWELSTLGDALADVSYHCQTYYTDKDDITTLGGADLDALGIPNEAEFLAEYCRIANRPAIDNWPFYVIYNLFRSSGIIQGVYKRGLDGNASSATALEYKDTARQRSEAAWSLVQQHYG